MKTLITTILILAALIGSSQITSTPETYWSKTGAEWRRVKVIRVYEDETVPILSDSIKYTFPSVPPVIINRMPQQEIEQVSPTIYWKSTKQAKAELTYGLRIVISQRWEKFEQFERVKPQQEAMVEYLQKAKELNATALQFWAHPKILEIVPIQLDSIQ